MKKPTIICREFMNFALYYKKKNTILTERTTIFYFVNGVQTDVVNNILKRVYNSFHLIFFCKISINIIRYTLT